MEYRTLAKDYIKKVNTDFSEGTLKIYGLKLDQLNRDINNNLQFDSKFPFVNDYTKVYAYIKDFNTDNSLSFLNAIISIIQDVELKNIYKKKRNEYSNIKSEKYLNNAKSSNFTEYKDMLEKTQYIDFENGTPKSVITKFMLYMSIRYPIRLELYNLPIIRVKKNMNPDKNYFYITKGKMEIIMNSFKNVKTFGKSVILIDKVDEEVIKKYLVFLTNHNIKHRNLIENSIKDEVIELNYSTYRQRLKSELNKLFKNKNLTMNDIRSSYESDLMGRDDYKIMTNLEKTKLHHRLLHNMESAFKNYNKV